MRPERKEALFRLGLYAFLMLAGGIGLLLIQKYGGIPCFFYENYGVTCPSCGATRAFFALLRLQIVQAADYHPVFALGLYPILGLILVQDLVVCLWNLFACSRRISFLQFLGGRRDDRVQSRKERP